jgi:beta-lactamase class A
MPSPSALLSRRGILLAAAAVAALARPGATAHAQGGGDLAEQVARRIAQVPGARVGVAYVPLDGAPGLALDADAEFHAASTMKVPVMVEVFRQAERGGAELDQPVLLVNDFTSIADGSPFSVSPADDSDSSMYARIGDRVRLRELVERMIVRSSNLATNAVIALADPVRVTATLRSLGASRMRVLRGVEDGKAYERGLNNTATAADLAAVLRAIAEDRAASPAACAAMRSVLERQEFNDEIPAGLPPGTRVAHKTGQITAVLHDAAIVYPPRRAPYVLVVLTSDVPDERTARALIVDVSRLVWEAHGAR